jgi:hypothetical protein
VTHARLKVKVEDDLDGWCDEQHGGHKWMDGLAKGWVLSSTTPRNPTDNHSLIQLPPNQTAPEILT